MALSQTKRRSIFVQSGKIKLYHGWDDDIEKAEITILRRGDKFHVPIGLKHRMFALEDTELFEFSTEHMDSDSHRIMLWRSSMIENITDMIYVERDVLSQDQCDEMIKYFWDNPQLHDDGKVEHFKDGEYQGKLVNKEHKNCIQFQFEPHHKYANLMTQVIQDAYLNYRYQLPVLPASDLAILDYTIRCYEKGKGIFKTHVDQAEGGTISRLFAVSYI